MKTTEIIRNGLVLLAFSVAICFNSKAQELELEPYLTPEDVASSKTILPPPPEPGSVEFLVDEYYYFQSKLLRDTPRGLQAIEDAKMGETVLLQFEEAFGFRITQETMPATFHLLMRSKECFGSAGCNEAKEYYHRTRPFVFYGESSLTSWDDEWLMTNYSYPSGHSANFYGLACIMSALNPARQNELYLRAEDGAYSRVIAGCHWMSDIRAARVIALMVFSRLQSCPEYIEDYKLAKEEVDALVAAKSIDWEDCLNTAGVVTQ